MDLEINSKLGVDSVIKRLRLRNARGSPSPAKVPHHPNHRIRRAREIQKTEEEQPKNTRTKKIGWEKQKEKAQRRAKKERETRKSKRKGHKEREKKLKKSSTKDNQRERGK